ncbi:MAG: hypothetical protein ACPGJS_13855, partial [Flammeovirgaceae bacterium]
MKKVLVYHLLFWLFIFGLTLDAMLLDYELKEAILFSLLECTINAFIAYTNLFVFIPKILEKKGTIVYVITIIAFYSVLFML